MQKTGIVRKIDSLGRFVIPKEIRRDIGAKSGSSLEIFRTDKGVFLKKYNKKCIFCDTADIEHLIQYEEKLVCKECLKKMYKKLD